MRKTLAILAAFAGLTFCAGAEPTAVEVLAANKAATGGSAWDSKIAMRIDADYSGQGLTGTAHTVSNLKDGRSMSEFKLGPATGGNGFDGTTPWYRDSSGTVTQQQGGDALLIATNDAYRTANKWWLADFGGAKVVNLGRRTDSTGQYDVLSITPKGGKTFEAWFDSNTHFLAKTVEQQGSETVTTTMSDYRPECGVMVPHKIAIDRGLGAKYRETIAVTQVQFPGPQPDAVFAAPKITAADFAIADGATETTLPIRIINNHIYGEASVNGKGPFTFIFDTGGHNIVTPPIAKQLGLKVEGNLPTTGAGEGVMEGGFVSGVQLEVGKATVKNQLLVVFPLDALSDIEGVPLPGMVGFETFRRFVTRIDYGAGTLTLIDATKFNTKDAGTPVPFVFNGHVPEVTGTFEGLPAKFDIDTGARSELTITKPFADQHGLRATHPRGVEAVDGWGVGGPSTGYITRGAGMTLGDVHVGAIVVSLANQSKGAFSGNDYSGNVGGGILKRFVVTFDYHRQIMYLKPLPQPVADTGTFDRAGMWFNRSGTGFKVVDVTRGGPAQQAGIKTGDLIVAVDGTVAANIPLPELRLRLRNDPPGTVVYFRVLRGSAAKTLKVKLRDQI